ncbi:MAG: hypothetical protein R3D02_16370 [Hyphomicrobiales bacterium]
MFWAVSSALAAVPVIAALEEGTPEAVDLAKRFYAERIADTFWRQARVGRDFYRLEERFADAPYWAARRAFPDDLPSHAKARAQHRPRRHRREQPALRARRGAHGAEPGRGGLRRRHPDRAGDRGNRPARRARCAARRFAENLVSRRRRAIRRRFRLARQPGIDRKEFDHS